MTGKDFLSVADLTPEGIGSIVQSAQEMKRGESQRPLAGKTVALLFEKPSLRTRVSFEVGIRQLGGQCIYLSRDDVSLGTREPVEDVARVLDRMVDAIVARVSSHSDLETLASRTSGPVINALSDVEHPCQAIGDILTIQEHRGRLEGSSVTFVGDGNNTASSLALACASVGAGFTLASPSDYRIRGTIWEEAERRASLNGSKVRWVEEPDAAVRDADVVYTDVWVSMGQEDDTERRLKAFSAYQVDDRLFDLARPDAIFMHDLPAHRGQEISEGMLDHPRSVVFDQAENRMHAQKALLVHLLAG